MDRYPGDEAFNMYRYEKEGDHYNIYDMDGRLVAKYGDIASFGTENRIKQRIYTIDEAIQSLGKNNKNKFSITYH